MADEKEIDPVVRNVDRRIAQRALEMIQADAALDDDIYTPPGALGGGGLDGPEETGDREPRKPLNPSAAGSIALKEPV